MSSSENDLTRDSWENKDNNIYTINNYIVAENVHPSCLSLIILMKALWTVVYLSGESNPIGYLYRLHKHCEELKKRYGEIKE